jgi:hypothetical protein
MTSQTEHGSEQYRIDHFVEEPSFEMPEQNSSCEYYRLAIEATVFLAGLQLSFPQKPCVFGLFVNISEHSIITL